MSEELKNNLKEEILKQIESGKAAMKPRWHFVLKTIFYVVGVVLVCASLLFLTSLIFFALRINGAWFAPGFGAGGWFVFFRSLPWVLIVFSLLFIFLLEVLVKKYAFAYKKPLLYSVLGITALAFVGGWLGMWLHRPVMDFARQNKIPYAGEFYKGMRRQGPKEVRMGEILSTTTGGLVIFDRKFDAEIKVLITSKTRLREGDNFVLGEFVAVFGEPKGEEIEAFGIRRAEKLPF